MHRKLVISIAVGLVIVSAGYWYISFQKDSSGLTIGSPSRAPSTTQTVPGSAGVQTIQPTAVKGVYTDYSETKLAQASGIKLLFFHASWCPQCRSIETSIQKDGLPDNVTVFKVDYDSNQKLRQKYGVTIQTTFVKVDDSGNKIASYVAYQEPTFDSVRRELL